MVTYTAIFGSIQDRLCRPPTDVLASGAALHAYVDRPSEEGWHQGWQVKPPCWRMTDLRRQARQHKLLPHLLYPHAEYSLWIDGCFTPLVPMPVLVERFLRHTDMALFQHRERYCIYEEARACRKLKKDHPAVIARVVKRYRDEGYPECNGLCETGVLLRRHTPAIRRFNEAWWELVRTGSCRDQLSFNYLCWKTKTPFTLFPGSCSATNLVEWRPHR